MVLGHRNKEDRNLNDSDVQTTSNSDLKQSKSCCSRCFKCICISILLFVIVFFILLRFVLLPLLNSVSVNTMPHSFYTSTNDEDEDWNIPYDANEDDEDEDRHTQMFQNDDGSIHIQMGNNNGNDIFSSIFGGLFGGNRVNKEFYVSLKDVYMGLKKQEFVSLSHQCSHCGGRGVQGHVCSQCGGQGIIMSNMGFMHCPRCQGQGFIAEKQCPYCNGQGQIHENIPVQLDILPGTENGHIYKEFHDNERLLLKMNIQEHPLYKRDNNDLRITHTITLGESLFGFSHDMFHLDGHKYVIASQSILNDEDIITLKGEGMPIFKSRHGYGNLYVTIKISFPTKLSDVEKHIIEENLPDE